MPLLIHPTEWPEATKSALTHKIGPLPVWAWGAIIVGGIVVVRALGNRTPSSSATPNKVPTGATLLPGSAGGYNFGGGGGNGGSADAGGGGITGSDSFAGSPGASPYAGGVSSGPPGSAVPSTVGPSTPANGSGYSIAGASGADMYQRDLNEIANQEGLLAAMQSAAKAGQATVAYGGSIWHVDVPTVSGNVALLKANTAQNVAGGTYG